MHAFDAQGHGKLRPIGAGFGGGGNAGIGGQAQERLFVQPGHHAGIGPAARSRGRATDVVAAQRADLFAQGVIGAVGVRQGGAKVKARPRFDNGINVLHAEFGAKLHQQDTVHIDRKIDDHPLARGEQPAQRGGVVIRRQGELQMADAMVLQDMGKLARGFDHGELAAVKPDMAFDQGQRAAPDRAEADHDQRPVNAGVNGMGHRDTPSIRSCRLWPAGNPSGPSARPKRQR